MGYVLEGIIVPRARFSIEALEPDELADFEILELNERCSILAKPGRGPFSEAVSKTAASLSLRLDEAVVVRWDDRVGHRSAEVFRAGVRIHEFDADDELHVLLDDNGYPLVEGQKYSSQDLDHLGDKGEVGLYRNALELACDNSVCCPWGELRNFIEQQR